MSTALYRRYRPETFAEVIGQDHVTDPLKAALKANRVTHAYLFSGPRGCGKTTSARILARCLNCVEGPTDTPCGKCDSCIELATGGPGSLDVVEIDAASHNGVDDARELRERAAFAPARDRYKVFILDEAHMVTPQGFNALLKLVEEPPEHVKFVFATTEPERVIGTIRSRTHHYPFRLVPGDVLTPYLQSLCDAEGIGVAQGVLPLVVRAGGGSVRDSLSVLDQLMAGAQAGQISYDRAIALLGYTDGVLLDSIVTQLHAGNGSAVFDSLEKMIDSGHDPRRFVEDFLQRLRDLLVISLAPEGARSLLQGIPVEQAEGMYQQASMWGPAKLSKAADLTDEALRSMVGATSPKLQVELLVGRILVETQGLTVPVGTAAPVAAPRAATAERAPVHNADVSAQPQLSGAAMAREELRRQREKAEATAAVKPEAQDTSVVEAPAQGLGYSVDPLPQQPVAEPAEIAQKPGAVASEEVVEVPQVTESTQAESAQVVPEVVPEEAVEVAKLSERWAQFTQNFLQAHPGWNNVVAALKLHQETDTEVVFQLPTVDYAERMSAEGPVAKVMRVVEHTLGYVKRVKFVGPLVVADGWESQIEAEEPVVLTGPQIQVVPNYQSEPSYQP
ncbi:MAG: DNA polymerase III subunit gamma and tau, partial [Actinomycetaceae bacterium]|nr:DNA polymerase III subunit gamma and tau [Actinomycetaceae bacterium]